MNRPRQVIEKWVEALNAHDAVAAASLYHEDAENLQVAIGSPLVGREAIQKDFEAFFLSAPDTFTKIENVFEDGEWTILGWSGGGTFKQSNLPARPYRLRGCGFFQVLEGKIKQQRGYWDKATWFRQIGLPVE